MSAARRKLFEMIEDMETALFTTRRKDGHLVSRPMATQVRAAGADLWFVTYEGAEKLDEIRNDRHVNLAYYKDRTKEWVSISGMAKISRNRDKIRELYRPDWRAWFADDGSEKAGTAEDPRMVLIAVDIRSAMFLELDRPSPVVAFELVKGIITRKAPKLGKMHKLTTSARRSRPASKAKAATKSKSSTKTAAKSARK